MQKTKLGGRFWLALTVFSLVGQVAWVVENMYFNVFIYKMFHATAAQISLMVAASAVVATLTTILIGALSDRVGRRKIFICVGYLLWGISILSFALIPVEKSFIFLSNGMLSLSHRLLNSPSSKSKYSFFNTRIMSFTFR